MICLRCDSEDFEVVVNALFEQEYKGKLLFVRTPGVICRSCGWQTIGNGQIDDLIKATKTEYEKIMKYEAIQYGFPFVKLPEKHPKGWGYELWIANNEMYCGKILHFDAGKKCSFHYHKKKHEHFYVLKGTFGILLSRRNDITKAEVITMNEGGVIEIPPGLRHQMMAIGTDGDLMEVSTEHFEDDSYRVVKGD